MWNDARVVVEEIGTGVRTTIAEGRTYGRYVPTGHIVYVDADGTLEAVSYDLKNHRVAGNAFLVESGVRTSYWGGAASFAISESGTLAFIRGSSWVNHQLTWFDRAGTVIERVGQPATVEGVRLSPDGRYAVTYVASNNADISLFDLATGVPQLLTRDPETEDNPIWSADGQRVAYHKLISGNDHRLYSIDISQGAPEELYADSQYISPRGWSPDGKSLAAFFDDGSLRIINLDDRSVTIVTEEDPGVGGGTFSPDGRWLTYTSSETGVREVYVIAFPDMTRPQQVSRGGGRLPEWSAESDELFFINRDTLMVSDVSTGDDFSYSTPRALFASSDLLQQEWWYGVSADGQRILLPAPNPDAPAREIHVVTNWFEHLKAMEGN